MIPEKHIYSKYPFQPHLSLKLSESFIYNFKKPPCTNDNVMKIAVQMRKYGYPVKKVTSYT